MGSVTVEQLDTASLILYHDKIGAELLRRKDMDPKFKYPEDNPEHPNHDPLVAAAWAGKKKTERKFEVRLFAGMRMVRLELLDANGKHVDHVDMTNEEYLHVCGFKDMVEANG